MRLFLFLKVLYSWSRELRERFEPSSGISTIYDLQILSLTLAYEYDSRVRVRNRRQDLRAPGTDF